MIIESLNKYLEIVAEYIFDDDKLVTYKWLSKNLEVHVNVAKQILWEFWKEHKEEKNFVCVFLLMGTLHNGGMRVEVVKEENLLKAKEKFNKIISEHIYSLQKVLPDIQLLSLSEYGDTKYGGIKSKECIERSNEELYKLRWGATSTETHDQEKLVPSVNSTREEEKKSSENKSVQAKNDIKKKGFNNLFGKVDNKPSVTIATENVEVKSSTESKQKSLNGNTDEPIKKKAQKNGLYSFLEQGKNQEKTTKPISPEAKIIESSLETEKTEEKTVEKKNNHKSTRGKKRNRSKEESTNIGKRRKRIVIQSDSSDAASSNDEGEEEEEEKEEPEPSPPPIKHSSPPRPAVIHEGGRRRILKMVDKTFEEDGYLITKKVHVYESCSDNEEEAAQKPQVSEPRQEVKEKKNVKQTTLMSYFKKS